MLIPIPAEIIDKYRWDPKRGDYLTDPHTEKEQEILDQFLAAEKRMADLEVSLDSRNVRGKTSG